MGFLIGTDEAGYGPNFGPLVVSATVWQVADGDLGVDLYQRLAPLVVQGPAHHESQLAIADSKNLYRPGGGLAGLERAVLTALSVTSGLPRDWEELWRLLCPQTESDRVQLPWYRRFRLGLPVDTDGTVIGSLSEQLRSQMDRSAVRLISIKSAVLFPGPFNRLVTQYDSKGAVLSAITLDLVRSSIAPLPPEPIHIVCDKHGGRNHYAALLQPRFGEGLIRVIQESREASIYDVSTSKHKIEIHFRARGEAFLPSALASMTSKYLREIAMKAFNRFWSEHVQDLKPTAGYPTDARRFKQQIAAAQIKLGIGDSDLWRNR